MYILNCTSMVSEAINCEYDTQQEAESAARTMAEKHKVAVSVCREIKRFTIVVEEENIEAKTSKLIGPISDLNLKARPENALKLSDVHRIEELMKRTEIDLLKMTNMGRKSVREVQEALNARGLRLKKRD